jgi:hypothetical protein
LWIQRTNTSSGDLYLTTAKVPDVSDGLFVLFIRKLADRVDQTKETNWGEIAIGQAFGFGIQER